MSQRWSSDTIPVVNRTAAIASACAFVFSAIGLWIISPPFVCGDDDVLSITQARLWRIIAASLIVSVTFYVLVDFV